MPIVSIVVPAHNEEGALPNLIAETHAAMAGHDYEILIVDDGSDDGSEEMLRRLAQTDERLRVLRNEMPSGKSGALYRGIQESQGETIVVMDGDGENDPKYLPELIAPLADPGIGLVAGQRVGRKASWSKRMASKIANAIRGALLKDGTRDSGCGLRAGPREAFRDLPYFDSMHRFMPALVLSDGWRIAHVDVVDRPRLTGTSHYGIFDRLAVGIPDLFGVAWLCWRRGRRRTMRKSRDQRA